MWSRARWSWVLAGIAATLVLFAVLQTLNFLVALPLVTEILGLRIDSSGNRLVSVAHENVYLFLPSSSVLLTLALSFFGSGFLVGRFSPRLAESSALTGTVLLCVAGLGYTLWVWVPGVLINDYYARADNIGNFVLWLLAFCVAAPVTVAASYLGARLGGCTRPDPTEDRSSLDEQCEAT